MTMFSDGMLLGVGAGVVTPTITYIGATDGNTNASETFSGVSIGAADAARIVVVVCSARYVGATLTLNSVTIGGVSATLIKNTVLNVSTCIAYAPLPAGATASIAVAYSGVMDQNKRIAVYSVLATNPTPADFKTTTITSGTSISASLSGCAVALMATQHVLYANVTSVSNAAIDNTYAPASPGSNLAQVCAKITNPAATFSANFNAAPTGYSASMFSIGWS